MSDWQPIETAPKDGLHVVCGFEKNGKIRTSRAQFSWLERGRWFSHYADKGYGAYPIPFKPTHWKPLPSPPEDT
jgi:hypothetical protein